MPETRPSALRKVPALLVLAVGVMLAGAAGSVALKPTHMTADDRPDIVLEKLIPSQFGDWVVDEDIPQVAPDPTVMAKLDTLYSQTLNRTFVNSRGERIMLSIAYGRNQNSQSTAAHRPEFCYSAQGFNIEHRGFNEIQLPEHSLKVARLLADLNARIEPITYWMTLDNRTLMPGIERKLTQLQYGLKGEIADGMLMRISSFAPTRTELDYALHDQFAKDLEAGLPKEFKNRFFGS